MALCSLELLPPRAEVIKRVKELFEQEGGFSSRPGSSPKGIKSQAPRLRQVQLQCPALGAAGPALLVEVFQKPRAAPEFQQPPPASPWMMGVRLQGGGWMEGAQVCSRFGCTSEGLGHERSALGSTQMWRDLGRLGEMGRVLGGPWKGMGCRV